MWPFSALFGNPKTTEKVVDAAVKGLDAIVFTAEEKAAIGERFRDWYIRYLEATQPQNLSRRLIALIVTLMWSTLVLAGVLTFTIAPGYSEYIFRVLDEVVGQPFALIAGFYFGAHLLRQLPIGKGDDK